MSNDKRTNPGDDGPWSTDPGWFDALTAWLGNVWTRALVGHPALFVGPIVALCYLRATAPGSDIDDVWWGFYGIPIASLASFFTTTVMAVRRRETVGDRIGLVLGGVVGSGVAFLLGFFLYLHAAEIACHGAYECPM